MARGSDGESALHKHLRVLDAFDAFKPFLTLTEIAAATGIALSTVHRLASELSAEGLLERMPNRSYRLGIRLWEYASRTPGALGLKELARPWLGAVHERVRQHAQLGVLSGQDVLFIERMSAPDAVINATLIGSRLPVYTSSSGLVILAFSDPELLDAVISSGLRPLTSAGIRTPEDLRERVRRVRIEGFAVTDGFIHPDSRGIAVPVRNPEGGLHASMSVVVANDESAPLPYVEILQWASVRTAHALNAFSPGRDGDHAQGPTPLHAGVSRKSLEYFDQIAGRVAQVKPGRPSVQRK